MRICYELNDGGLGGFLGHFAVHTSASMALEELVSSSALSAEGGHGVAADAVWS